MITHPGPSIAPALPLVKRMPSEMLPAMQFRGIPITETTSFPPMRQAQCWVYVTLNAEVALTLQQNTALQALLASHRARVSVDGQWVWWALRRKYPEQRLQKMAGSDLIHDLAAFCAANGKRLLLLGSSATANENAVRNLRLRWPALDVQGHAPEQFSPGEESERLVLQRSLELVAEHKPHYVVLGLSPAKQFRFASQLAAAVDGQVEGLFCFGGAIDMVSGQVKRAPLVWQQWGLEGIYRTVQQPSRLGRFMRLLPIIPIVAFKRY